MATNQYIKKFINLTSRVINKSHIVEIIKHPNKYDIHMSNLNLYGFTIFAIGSLTNNPNIIEICNKNNKQDYDTITEFIKNEFT